MAKKGEKLGFIPVRAFKKGQIPHNKGKIFYGNKICGYCHKEFIVRGKGAFSVKKYCSKKCSGFSNIGKPSPFKGIPRTEELKRKLSLANKGKKRSEKIKKEMSERSIGMHYSPNTEFKKGHIAPETAFKLNDIRLIGKNNPRWKGGISPINQMIRGSLEYKLWSDSVWNKDNNCCQKCGDQRISKLVAHHILNFSDHIEIRFAINNGITFCKDCHKEFHKRYGKKNNTLEQVKEFLKN